MNELENLRIMKNHFIYIIRKKDEKTKQVLQFNFPQAFL